MVRKLLRNVALVGFSLLFVFVSPMTTRALTAAQLYDFAQNNILYYEPDGSEDCVVVTSLNQGGNTDGRDVYIIGDSSVMDETMVNKIRQKMSQVAIDTVSDLSGGGWVNYVDSSNATSRPILVMTFGQSGGTFNTQEFMNKLSGRDVKVVLVTAPSGGSNDSTIKTLAQDNSNISAIDFATLANTNPSKYLSGGRLTADGYDYYVSTLQSVVNGMTVVNANAGTDGTVNLSQTQLDFVDKYHDIAANLSLQYGIPWEAVMAQGILESGAGTSNFAINRNNFFGIGAFDSNTDNAYSFDTPEEGWLGYYENIRRTSVYRNNGIFQGATVTDPYEYIVIVKQAGYATDPIYVDKLFPIVKSIIAYSNQKGWASSAQIAAAHPEWFENAAKNAEGAGSGSSGSVNYSGFFCADPSSGTNNPSSGGSGSGSGTVLSPTIGGEADRPITGVPISESSAVACDPRTTDMGVFEGHMPTVQGGSDIRAVQIRLCKLDKPGYQIYGNDGGIKNGSSATGSYVYVNSLVSGAFAALANYYYQETGEVLQGTSGYRTQAYQQHLSNTNAGAASVGKSKHEIGLAIDITTGCSLGIKPGECGTTMDKWLTRVVGGYNVKGGFGLIRPVSNEAWHVQMPVWEIQY